MVQDLIEHIMTSVCPNLPKLWRSPFLKVFVQFIYYIVKHSFAHTAIFVTLTGYVGYSSRFVRLNF